MSKTYRNVPHNKWMRTPKYKHKLKAGDSRKSIVTDWDDKPIAAIKEIRRKITSWIYRFPSGYKA